MPPAQGTDPAAAAPLAAERVLSTLNLDGSRRWLRPRPSKGVYLARRRAVAYALMVVFFLVPYLSVHGKPLLLLDLPRREFTFVGTTFLSTETIFFQLFFLAAVVALFLFTALLGRVWCGWACPQTVYLEFLFRPVERWLEGGFRGSLAMDAKAKSRTMRWVKYGVYLVLSAFLAHTFLGYFVRVTDLAHWMLHSPSQHWTAFLVVLATTGLIFFDFAIFREQTCLVACPYGRLQSVLLDRRSLIVTYDPNRGEPRGKGWDRTAKGDCVDCKLCVQTCPTGIDIREGLQMECIHCTQCMDACDAVMLKIQRPKGLIRYGSRAELEGQPAGWLRPRTVLYPLALALVLGLFGVLLARRADSDVTLLKSGAGGAPYTLEADGRVINQVRLKITNRRGDARTFRIAWPGRGDGTLVAPINPLPVAGEATGETSVFLTLPRESFHEGTKDVTLRIEDEKGHAHDYPVRLVGPEREGE